MSSASEPKRFLIMAGGTGGHVYPALSVASELESRGHSVFWLGTHKGIESKLVPAAKIPLHEIQVTGIRGKGIKASLKAPLNLVRALAQSHRVIKKLSPKVVVGFGGFVAGPGGVAAKFARIPLVVHEQNARAGTTNKWLARIATKVLAAFPGALKAAAVVGNPIRGELVGAEVSPSADKLKQGRLNMLVIGGSLGATFLNNTIAKALSLIDEDDRPFVKHQCGERWLDDCSNVYAAEHVDAEVLPYIEDMANAYQWADFLVCRAGAMTVSEVAAAGVPALFVPFPYAIDDHQTANARWLVDGGAARLVQQSELTPERMKQEITFLLKSGEQLGEMGFKARALAITNATEQIANVCEELANVA